MSILQEILIHKKEELKQKKNSLPLKELKARLKDIPPAKNLRTALKRDTGGPIKLVAEIKKASPSTGLNDHLSPNRLSLCLGIAPQVISNSYRT